MLPYKGKKQWYTGAGVVGIIQSREYAIHKVSMGNENFCGKKIEHDFLKFIVKFIQGRRCNSRVRQSHRDVWRIGMRVHDRAGAVQHFVSSTTRKLWKQRVHTVFFFFLRQNQRRQDAVAPYGSCEDIDRMSSAARRQG